MPARPQIPAPGFLWGPEGPRAVYSIGIESYLQMSVSSLRAQGPLRLVGQAQSHVRVPNDFVKELQPGASARTCCHASQPAGRLVLRLADFYVSSFQRSQTQDWGCYSIPWFARHPLSLCFGYVCWLEAVQQ